MAASMSGLPIHANRLNSLAIGHVASSLPISASFFTIKQRANRKLSKRNSTGDAGETATATETESGSPVEVPKGPLSLVSALNVEKALRGIAITDADHYGRLGVARGCSADDVRAAYQRKVNEGSGSEAEVELLKESYRILSTAEERRLYDWSLRRSENPDRYMWPFEVDKTPLSDETPPPQEAEDVVPTRLVGYFLLTWLVLSVALFILFDR